MKLLVKRNFKGSTYTIGKLYIDGVYLCDTLEDPDRGLKSSMQLSEIKKLKVYSDTAIPTGTYKIDMNTVSPKFKDRVWAKPWSGKLPRLVNVPGYEGVLVHVGNSAQDTLGCVLVGTNSVTGQLTNSTIAFNKLMEILTKTKEEITIIIE